MELLTVGEMARHSGVPATTLRYYDSLGLITPIRLANNHRRYRLDMVERLQIIRLCQELGCELDEIRDLIQPYAAEERRMAAKRNLVLVDRKIQRMTTARDVLAHFAECTCADTDECRAKVRAALDAIVNA